MGNDGVSRAPVSPNAGWSATAHPAVLWTWHAALYGLLALPVLSGSDLPGSVTAISMVLAACLIALSVIDLRTFRLPDVLTVPLILAGVACAWVVEWDAPVWRIAAALAGYLFLWAVAAIYRRLRGREGLGLGDAKLLAGGGAWLGFSGLPTVMLWATGIAILCVLIAALLGRRIEGAAAMPFGPFLALGFWLVWLYGPV